MESTIDHIFKFFQLCCFAEHPPETLDRVIGHLGSSKDSSVQLEVSSNLCSAIAGAALPSTATYLDKAQAAHQKRAYQIMSQIVKKNQDFASTWITRLADLTPTRKVCAGLLFDAVRRILVDLNEETQRKLVKKVSKLMKFKNVKVRANMLVVAKAILSVNQEDLKLTADESSVLLSGMMARVRDVSANVQCRALMYCAELLQGQMANVNESLIAPGRLQPSVLRRYSMASRRSTCSSSSQVTTNSDAFRHTVCETIIFNEQTRSIIVASLVPDGTPIGVIRQLHENGSNQVRKAVFDFTKALVLNGLLNDAITDGSVVELFDKGCRDMLVSVRQHAFAVFTALTFEYQQVQSSIELDNTAEVETLSNKLVRCWLNVVLPMAEDKERSVADKVYMSIYEKVLVPLTDFDNHFINVVLSALDEVELETFYTSMRQLIMQFTRDEKVTHRQWVNLARRMTEKTEGQIAHPWIILRFIHEHKPDVVDVEALLSNWTQTVSTLIKESPQAAYWSTVLIRELVKSRPDERRNILTLVIQKFMSIISMDMNMMKTICNIFRDAEDAENKSWITNEAFTMKRFHKLMQRIEEGPHDEVVDKVNEAAFRANIMSMFYEYYPRSDQLELCNIIITPFATEDVEQKYENFIDSALWSLGRICCVDNVEAERIVIFFGAQLKSQSSSNGAKIGSLGALADLCRVKTQLTDKFIDIIATMMEDKSPAVAMTALKAGIEFSPTLSFRG